MNIYEIASNILKIPKCTNKEEFEKYLDDNYPCNLVFRQIIGNDLDNETCKMLWLLICQSCLYLKNQNNIRIQII